MAIGPIPLSEVICAVEFMGITSCDRKEEAVLLVRAMDEEYLKATNEKSKRKVKEPKKR